MPVFPQAPYDMDTFQQQAQNFIAKAKAAGKSNTAISNTLKFMYQMTLENVRAQEAQQMTPYQEASIDIEQQKLEKTTPNTEVIEVNGTKKLIDKSTGQVIQDYSAGGNGILSQIEASEAGSDSFSDVRGLINGYQDETKKTAQQSADDALKKIGAVGQKKSFIEGWGINKNLPPEIATGDSVYLDQLSLPSNIFNQQTPDPAQLTQVGQTQSPFRLLPGFAIQ